MSKLRVLVIAESANPEWASVPLEGYSHAQALFEVCDAHVVTQVRNAEALRGVGWRLDQDFTTIDSERVAKPLHQITEAIRKLTGLGWTFDTAMRALPYYYFERLLLKRFGDDIKQRRFDVVHRLTPLSPTIPSIMGPFCSKYGVPFIWGPINGGVPWPKGFGDVQRREGDWLHYVRNAYRLMPGYRSTLSCASALIAGSMATYEQLPEEFKSKAVYVPENAIDPARFPQFKPQRATSSPLRVAFVGRLVPYKGADILIEAAADLMRNDKLVLDIIGDGPEKPRLHQLVQALGVTQQVRLQGWVPHQQLAARLIQSDVFGFPSVREFGGAVVLEAMAVGLVPIVADYAGPAEHVTEGTGYRVPLGTRPDLIRNLREVLERLVADPIGLPAMGERARQRVLHHYTWPAKARQVLEIYRWIKGERTRPNFGMPLPDDDFALA